MTKNYFIFSRQITDLKAQITGSQIVSIYTENKDELTILLEGEHGIMRLLLGVNKARPYIILKDTASKKGRKFKFFPAVYGKKIKDILGVPGNKHLILNIDSYEIQAVFYGPAANVYFFHPDKNYPDLFKSSQKIAVPERAITLRMPDTDCLTDLLNADKELPVTTFLKSKCPALNNLMLNEILTRGHFNHKTKIKDLDRPDALYDIFKNFYHEFIYGPAYLYKNPEAGYHLTLFKSVYLEEKGFQAEIYTDINKAWDIFLYKGAYARNYNKLKDKINKALQKARHNIEISMQRIHDAEDINKHKNLADLKGNLLLTNLHKIRKGSKYVELKNILDGNNELIGIKLNPSKSIAENANYYFNKYKNKNEKLEILKLKKSMYVKELMELDRLTRDAQSRSIKTLQKLEEKLIAMHLLAGTNISSTDQDKLKFSFKRLIIEGEWDIFIGKNNINNELLTFSFANKWDIWLHAQGVSGSHVIIHRPSRQREIPTAVLEKAARITAANSKARHSATVPVIFTEARFVTRIRKALPGTVNVRNEKVMFVEPLSLNN